MKGDTLPYLFLLALILIAAAVVALALSKSKPRRPFIAIGLAACGVLFLVLSCTTVVGTRQIGVATQFNRPTGTTYSNGFHFKSPLVQVHEMDGAVQIDTYQGERRIAVRLGNNSTALADASVRWQIKQDAADELFVQYKTFDGVRVNLIERNLKVALNEAFAAFDPLAAKNLDESPLPAIAKEAFELLKKKVGAEVDILDVAVPTIDYDDKTEERINQINEERANTTKAEQEIKTNEARRQAAEKLAGMAPPDLRIAIANCLNKMAETGHNLNCFPIGQGVVPTLAIPNPAPGG